MSATVFSVERRYGYGSRTGVVMYSGAVDEHIVGIRQLQRYVADMRTYANVTPAIDRTDDTTGVRTVEASHWNNGFENIQQLTIRGIA